jgi:hypothetical protein
MAQNCWWHNLWSIYIHGCIIIYVLSYYVTLRTMNRQNMSDSEPLIFAHLTMVPVRSGLYLLLFLFLSKTIIVEDLHQEEYYKLCNCNEIEQWILPNLQSFDTFFHLKWFTYLQCIDRIGWILMSAGWWLSRFGYMSTLSQVNMNFSLHETEWSDTPHWMTHATIRVQEYPR